MALLGTMGLIVVGGGLPWTVASADPSSRGTVKVGDHVLEDGDRRNDPKITCDVVVTGLEFTADTHTATISFDGQGNDPKPTVAPQPTSFTFSTGFSKTYRLSGAGIDLVKVTVEVDNSFKKSKVFKYRPCVVPGTPDMSLEKTGSPSSVTPGQNITYTLSATNTSTVGIPGFRITDNIEAPLVFVSVMSNSVGLTCPNAAPVSCTYSGTLPVGGAVSATIVVTVPPSYTGTKVSNTAVVGPIGGGEYDRGSVETAVTQPSPSPSPSPPPPVYYYPDLGIVKAGPTTAVKPGESYTYALTVTNTGNGSASNVEITDTLPAGLTLVSATGTGFTCKNGPKVDCALAGVLVPAGTATLNVVVTLASTYSATSVVNTAVVTPTDSNPANNSDTETTPVTLPPVEQDLGISKTAVQPFVQPGDVLSWTVTVTNVKGTPASGFTVTDQMPAGLTLLTAGADNWTCKSSSAKAVCTYTGAPLAVGSTSAFRIDAVVSAGFKGTSVANTAVVEPGGVDATNDSATSTTPVVQPSQGGGGGEAVIPTPTPTPSGGGEVLPFTGAAVDMVLATGVAVLLAGLIVAIIGRQRHHLR